MSGHNASPADQFRRVATRGRTKRTRKARPCLLRGHPESRETALLRGVGSGIHYDSCRVPHARCGAVKGAQ